MEKHPSPPPPPRLAMLSLEAYMGCTPVPKGSRDMSPLPGGGMPSHALNRLTNPGGAAEQPGFIARVQGVHPRAGGGGSPHPHPHPRLPACPRPVPLIYCSFGRGDGGGQGVAGVSRGWQGSGGPAVARPLLVSGTMTRHRLFARLGG